MVGRADRRKFALFCHPCLSLTRVPTTNTSSGGLHKQSSRMIEAARGSWGQLMRHLASDGDWSSGARYGNVSTSCPPEPRNMTSDRRFSKDPHAEHPEQDTAELPSEFQTADEAVGMLLSQPTITFIGRRMEARKIRRDYIPRGEFCHLTELAMIAVSSKRSFEPRTKVSCIYRLPNTVGRMALNRQTSESVRVTRVGGKIAIEEAVGSPCWGAHETFPTRPSIQGIEALPFSNAFLQDISSRLNDVEARLESMDRCGIRYAVVSLTAPGIEGVFDAETAVDFARKTNDAIHARYVKAHPDRFGFFACLPTQMPDAAAVELERAVTQLGAKGALVNGYCNLNVDDINSVQYLDDKVCEPIWAMLAKLNVPLYLHPRSPPPNQQRLYKDYPNLAQAAYGFGVETAGHALRIMCSGVLDKYPDLNIILGHCAEALPFLIHRIDHRMAVSNPGTNGPHTQSMMHYFQRNFYATCAGVRRQSTLEATIAELGEGRVLFSVDYPYESNEDAADWFDGMQLNENTRAALGWENAERLLQISKT